MEKESGVKRLKTVKTLRPSQTTGSSFYGQERRTHIPRLQTSSVQVRSTPLATKAFFITKHATLQASTSIYQASSITNEWNNGHDPFRKLIISTPECNSIKPSFYDTKPSTTGVVQNPCSSSGYQAMPQASARSREGMFLKHRFEKALFINML